MGWSERLFSWNGADLAPAMPALPAKEAAAPENVWDGSWWTPEEWAWFTSLPQEAQSPETAARISAVYFCVSVIAETFGSLPVDLKDRDNRTVEHSLHMVLGAMPNPLQTSAEFWSAMAFTAALRGSAFAEPTVGLDQVELWPLDPLRSYVQWYDRSFYLIYNDQAGHNRTLVPSQLFWFSGLADATVRPLVPWQMAKGDIDFELALEYGARSFFRNDRRPAGWLTTEQKLTPEAQANIKAGVGKWKRGGIPVFEQGLKYESPSGNSNEDAQLAELIKQRTLQLARYWRIPRSMIGEDGGTAASQEQQALEFVKYTMRPWVRRIEQAVTARLLPPDMQAAGIRAKWNLDALLRGDSATQFRNAVLARTGSLLSINEIRTGWLDAPRVDDPRADDPFEPLNTNRAADTMTGGQTAPQDHPPGASRAELMEDSE